MLTATAVGLALAPGPALADAIDGDWCAEDGRHFAISGSAILTPGGTETTGNYTRHSFNYVVPAGEESAGEPVNMLLLNESAVSVETNGVKEIWVRCEMGIT